MRALEEASQSGNQRAKLAIEVFCYRLAKQLAALAVPLGRIDGLIFTGGIGENATNIRENVLQQLSVLGFNVDIDQNKTAGENQNGLITQPNSTPAYVVSTDEEWMIAKDTEALI